MATYSRTTIDIPGDKGVHVKSAGARGEKYVYKYVRYFRNSDGDARNQAKAIGKYDPKSGKMFPNSYYFELYKLDPALPDIAVWDYGYSYLVIKTCHDTGLLCCLTKAFGKLAMDIVVMAAYIIREGNAMDGIDDWLQRNYFQGFDRLLTSQSTSRIFASIAVAQANEFFVDWVKAAMGDGSVCYDVTSISSYAQEMISVERGYNRDGDNLEQYNLGMFCDELSKTPLYYNRYNGSLTDKTNLSYVLNNARAVGIERVKMILDGGFWMEGCFTNLNDICDAFTVGMPAYLKESESIISAHIGNVEKYENEMSNQQIYCVSVTTEIYGVSGRVLLYYDSWNHLHLCAELSNHINKLKAELVGLKRYPKSKLGRYAPYFVLTKHEEDSGFDFAVDTVKVEEMRKYKGYFLIFSNDMESSPADILSYYRAKDSVEKLFTQIKVDMDGNRARTHSEQTTDGKTFVTFIACTIRAYLLGRLAQYLVDNSSSLKKALNQLSNITIISGHDGHRFTKALTKKQKQILSAFDATDDILASLA
jgi:transposase